MNGLLASLLARNPDAAVQWGPNPYPAKEPPRPSLADMFGGHRGNLSEFYGPRPSGMVDQMEGGVVAIVDPATGQVIHMSADALPRGAHEGSYVRDRRVAPSPKSDAADIRQRLSKSDPGGDFAL